MIASLVIAAMLLCGMRWPGVLVAGEMFTFQASALSGIAMTTPVYTLAALAIALWKARMELPCATMSGTDVTFVLFLAVHCFSAAYSPAAPDALASLLRISAAAISMAVLGRLCGLAVPPHRLALEITGGLVVVGAVFAGMFLLGSAESDAIRLQIHGATAVGAAQPLPLILTAGFLAMVASLAHGRPALFLVCSATTLVCLHAAITSGTRGVFVGLAAALMCMCLLGARRTRIWVAIGVVAVIVAGALPLMPMLGGAAGFSPGLDRLLVNFRGADDISAAERMEQLSMGLALWTDNPFLGTGLGGYTTLTGRNYPHNIFVEVAAESGTVGLVVLSLHLGVLSWQLYSLSPGYARLLLTGLFVACLVHMQLSFSLFMAKPLFLLTGIAASIGRHSRQRPPVTILQPRRLVQP